VLPNHDSETTAALMVFLLPLVLANAIRRTHRCHPAARTGRLSHFDPDGIRLTPERHARNY
jgi:hypothetical protein